MDITFIPYSNQLLEGRLFESETFDNTKLYGPDRPAFVGLKEELQKRGHNVTTIDEIKLENIDVCVMVDIDYYYLSKLKDLKNPPKLIYLMRESPAYIEFNSITNITRYRDVFDKIVTWNPELAKISDKYKEYRLPHLYPEINHLGEQFEDRSLLCNISSRKYSTHPNELYSIREDLIAYFNDNHPNEFTLYGKGWDTNKKVLSYLENRIYRDTCYSVFGGTVESKQNVYHSFKFSLCLENISNVKGYVTEKIFDCLRYGIVPIYQGADDITEYIPESLFIDYRTITGPDELYSRITSFDEIDFLEFLENASSFLRGSQSKEFKPDFFSQRLANIITNVRKNTPNKIPNYLSDEISTLSSVQYLIQNSKKEGVNKRIKFFKKLLDNWNILSSNPELLFRILL